MTTSTLSASTSLSIASLLVRFAPPAVQSEVAVRMCENVKGEVAYTSILTGIVSDSLLSLDARTRYAARSEDVVACLELAVLAASTSAHFISAEGGLPSDITSQRAEQAADRAAASYLSLVHSMVAAA